MSTDGQQGSPQRQPCDRVQEPARSDGDAPQQASGVEEKARMQPVDEARAAQLTFDTQTGKFVMSHGSRVRLRVAPEEGMAVVFNHNMLHSGEELTHGEKWVLRSELMFEQVLLDLRTQSEKSSGSLCITTIIVHMLFRAAVLDCVPAVVSARWSMLLAI